MTVAEIFQDRRFPVFLCLFLFLSSSVQAQVSLEERLTLIAARVQSHEERLEKLNSERQAIQSKRRQLEGQRAALSTELEKLSSALDKNKNERASLEEELIQIEEDLARARHAARQRLRVLYMQREQGVSLLSASVDSSSLTKYALYTERLSALDRRKKEELILLLEEQQRRQAKLAGLVTELETLVSKTREREKTLASVLGQVTALEREMNNKSKELESLTLELRAQSLRLETLMQSLLTERSEEIGDSSSEHESSPTQLQLEADDGAGLSFVSASLPKPLPCSFQSSTSFHAKTSSGLSAQTLKKGVFFHCPKKEDVQAIGSGEVIFSGKMPTYGGMLILHHGKRHYSVYALLSSIEKSRGDLISTGDVIGTFDPLNSEALYFELRKGEEKIDPSSMLQ